MEKSKYIGSVSIGHQLKKYRELAGMTQYQMAAKLHLGETTYGNYERGVREPDIDTLKRICDYFHVSMDVMVGLLSCQHGRDGGTADQESADVR